MPSNDSRWKSRIIREELVEAATLVDNPVNWRVHPPAQQQALRAVLDSVGWVQRIIVNERTGHIVDGHLRAALATERRERVPVAFVDLELEEEQLILATIDPLAGMATTDTAQLDQLLSDLRNTPIIQDDHALQALLEHMAHDMLPVGDVSGVEKGTQPNPRHLPIDIIATTGAIGKTALDDPTVSNTACCLAVRSGLRYGIQSSGSGGVCPMVDRMRGHEIAFIDNDYFNYDHTLHLAAVAKWAPQYATVRDVMTPGQCAAENIEFYELAQILDWAEELNEHAQNVIIIPKWDCLDRIPEKFILGYSVPTSHGGTPLPAEAFQGRRVHLLGGSWGMQLAYMATLGDDIVSVDNNYVLKMAEYGGFVYPDGRTGRVTEDLGLGQAVNPRWISLAVSFGNMAGKINELYSDSRDGGASPQIIPRGGLRLATLEDIDTIKALADQHREELGFIRRPALEEAAERGWLLFHPDTGSFCNFRLRQDGITVIYEICTPVAARGGGVGRALVESLPRPIELKCPIDNASNEFYAHLGFRLIQTIQGKKRDLNVWRLS